MLAGHYAPALLIKQIADKRGWNVRLWPLCIAVQAVDIGFMALVLANVELGKVDNANAPHFTVVHGMWTHSLLMTGVYGAVTFGLALLFAPMKGRKDGVRLGIIAAIAVMSHWVGDLVVHVPDLPLGLADTPAVGLGLWRWPLAATALEIGLVAVTAGRFRLVAGFLIVVQVCNDLVLPLDTDQKLLAVKALALYAGVALLAWRSEGRMGGPAAR